MAVRRRTSASPVSAPPGAASAEQKLAHTLRCISLGEPGSSSPTAGLSHSAGAGAVLGRQAGDRLTPFSAVEVDGLRGACSSSLQRQHPEERVHDRSMPRAGVSACTPQRLPPALVLPAGAAPQSQPATPSDQHAPGGGLQPPHSQRRAWTAGYVGGTQASRTRHRRRLTLDLHGLANLRLDLQQPAVAAAFAIAANPSPGGRGSGGTSLAGSPADPGGSVGAAQRPTSCDAELLLSVRTLHFDEQEAGGAAPQEGQGATDSSSECLTRSLLAYLCRSLPLSLLLPSPVCVLWLARSGWRLEQYGTDRTLPCLRRCAAIAPQHHSPASSPGTARGRGKACSRRPGLGSSRYIRVFRAGCGTQPCACLCSHPAASPGLLAAGSGGSAAGGGSCGREPAARGGAGGDGAAADRCRPAPAAAQGGAPGGGQGGGLQAVMKAALSGAGTCPRHVPPPFNSKEAHTAAGNLGCSSEPMLTQPRPEGKWPTNWFSFLQETLVAELSCRLEASSAAITELGGEVSAKQLAVQAEEAALERRRRELAAADALIKRLMDAVAQTQKPDRAGLVDSSAGASTASTCSGSGSVVGCGNVLGSSSRGSAQSSPAHSPQSSIGSVSLARWASTPQRNANSS